MSTQEKRIIEADESRLLVEMLTRTTALGNTVVGVVVGELIAFEDETRSPLVRCRGIAESTPIPARTVVELQDSQIGRPVVLMFEDGDTTKPIVIGVVRDNRTKQSVRAPVVVEVDADGQRISIEAREQLVLRCGRASITLTKAGKVLIDGDYVSTRASSVNRIKGGSVQIN